MKGPTDLKNIIYRIRQDGTRNHTKETCFSNDTRKPANWSSNRE